MTNTQVEQLIRQLERIADELLTLNAFIEEATDVDEGRDEFRAFRVVERK